MNSCRKPGVTAKFLNGVMTPISRHARNCILMQGYEEAVVSKNYQRAQTLAVQRSYVDYSQFFQGLYEACELKCLSVS